MQYDIIMNTTFILQLRHECRDYLGRVRDYLKCLDERPASIKSLRSWLLEFGEVVEHGSEYVLHLFVRTKESIAFDRATRENESLTELLSRFPTLTIRGIYSDRYGSGRIFQAEQIYEYSDNGQVGTVVDFELA
jgi:hypothetical protein